MKKNSRLTAGAFQKFPAILLCISLIIFSGSCQNNGKKLTVNLNPSYGSPYNPAAAKWLDWNILFKPGTSIDSQMLVINNLNQYIKDYIKAYNDSTGNHFGVDQYLFNCPCDTLLWNLNAIPLAGSGQAPVLPPNPKGGGGVGGSGDAIAYVNMNNSFAVDSGMVQTDTIYANRKVQLEASSIDGSRILAVMDTGLDSTLFENKFAGLLWSDPQARTIRNFQFFNNKKPLDYYFDDETNKHGTAVTAIALRAMEIMKPLSHVKPRVMVLKVLDSHKSGSTFTVSCALSYAIQKQATLINASLGYYSTGDVDSVLRHYLQLCSGGKPQIPVLAAAGNLSGSHDKSLLCQGANMGNELTRERLFYPACFNMDFPGLISVTGLSDPRTACFYQNYSSSFVTVGVVTNAGSANCCRFPVEFLNSGYEGSSFATPVISGGIMGCLLRTTGAVSQNCLETISNTQSVKQVTIDGRYVNYTWPQ
jgi:hypothetical protein